MAVIVDMLRAQSQIFDLILHRPGFGGPVEDHYRQMSRPAEAQEPLYYRTEQAPKMPYYLNDPAHALGPGNESRLSPTDPSGFKDLIAQSCSEIINSKLQRFEQMELMVSDLERQVWQPSSRWLPPVPQMLDRAY